jgi:hypothetical protein
MRKRLMVGLASGALLAAMMPAVAAAGGPPAGNTGQCVKQGTSSRAANPSTESGPSVWWGGSDFIITQSPNFGNSSACGPIPPE